MRRVEEERHVPASLGGQEDRRLHRPHVGCQVAGSVLVQLSDRSIPEALVGIEVDRRDAADLESGAGGLSRSATREKHQRDAPGRESGQVAG